MIGSVSAATPKGTGPGLDQSRASDAAARSSRATSPIVRLFFWALVIGLLMSTEFLFQPFVWRNWSFGEILPAWLDIARDRVVVAIFIATALALSARLTTKTLAIDVTVQAGAVVIGAVMGELLLQTFDAAADRQDLISFAGRIARWSLIGTGIAVMLYVWRSGAELDIQLQEARADEARLRRLGAASRIEMLQRQIEPHFLFNTLATIRRLHETDPERGQTVLGRLLHLMSATLGAAPRPRSTLGEEIELVLAYLDVCETRMGNRLIVRCGVAPEFKACDFPPLALSTLAENAVKHGIAPRDGGTILISAEARDGGLDVAIIDDGAGFTSGSSSTGGGGMGLSNISERLRLLYGTKARLSLAANEPSGVRASIWIPLAAAT